MTSEIDDGIEIIGADANNLCDIDVVFPANQISMIAGVSGSGKSSLLSNTLAREGNSRLELFLGIGQDHLDPPESSAYVGRLPATIHVGQRAFRASSRTTVATSSGLLALLRRLFVYFSKPVSTRAGIPVHPPQPTSYFDWIVEYYRGPVTIWAIPMSYVANDGRQMAGYLGSLGIDKVVVRSETDTEKKWKTGRTVLVENFKPLNPAVRHLVEAEIGHVNFTDRDKTVERKLEEMLELAFLAGNGKVFVELPNNRVLKLDSRRDWVTPRDPATYRPPSEHLLSFNAPEHESSGACVHCRGLGRAATVDLGALVANPNRTIHDGAFSLWTSKNYKYINIQHETIEGLRGVRGFDPDIPWSKLCDDAKILILDGSGDELIIDRELHSRRKLSKPRPFPGFRAAIMRRLQQKSRTADHLNYLVEIDSCPQCNGTRWSAAARSLHLGDKSIDNLLALTFTELAALTSPHSAYVKTVHSDAYTHIEQIHRLAISFLGVGLGHLSGSRGMLDISEGESRRLRLASVLDGRHNGLCLLLDEPARGLHDEDVDRLSKTLLALRGKHTLLLNEHRRRMAKAADFFVELGPGAGPEGGNIVHAGKVPRRWWSQSAGIQREPLKVSGRGKRLTITGARTNNVNDAKVTIPLGRLVCIAGVSGSGKSSFVRGVLIPALASSLDATIESVDSTRCSWASITGVEHITGVVTLDQQAPVPNRRSTVATFLNLAESIRVHFANIPASKASGLTASDFGLNAGSGRCGICLGIGQIEEGDHWTACPECGGARFGSAVLTVIDGGMDIVQLLNRSISSLIDTPLEVLDPAATLLQTINELGVGHLSLGRRVDTISGGELQRLRIARELEQTSSGNLFFVLDEPAAGLHSKDVKRLACMLDRIVSRGHTVVVVEHNLELINASDWVIEFGPEGGPSGGKVIASAAPAKIKSMDTATGRMLKEVYKQPSYKLKKQRVSISTRSAVDKAEADSALHWLRRLLGDDLPPQKHDLEHQGCSLAATLDPRTLSGNRILEYGGLDHEWVSLMLEYHKASDPSFDSDSIFAAWSKHPKATLMIHPFIHEMYTWGRHIPASIYGDRKRQIIDQGLDWLDAKHVSELRAGGAPFTCQVEENDFKRRCVIDAALLAGGGYVELRQDSELLCIYRSRAVDLAKCLIGPLGVSPYDFRRDGRKGRCPTCNGAGKIPNYDRKYILGDMDCTVGDISFLHPGAREILKGVHRNVLIPFFRRMSMEGLWSVDVPLSKLPQRHIELLFHGFWVPNGPGQFLKNSKSNPKEVSSWLRWTGLVAHIHENMNRSNAEWRSNVESSHSYTSCPSCMGLGLRKHVELFEFNERSYPSWLATGTVRELHEALIALDLPSARSIKRRDRIAGILEPFTLGRAGTTKLNNLFTSFLWKDLGRCIVEAYTDLPLVIRED